MLKSSGGRGIGFCIIFLVSGAVIGGVLGELLQGVDALQSLLPYLVSTYPILEIPSFTLNLYVIKLAVGFSFTPNLMSILGVVLALFLYRKY